MGVKMSLYKSVKSTENSNISVDDYVNFVRCGTNQDTVIQARSLLKKGDKEGYKTLKSKSMCVTGSCTIIDGKNKSESNISEMNGMIVIDIDEKLDQSKYDVLRNDKYTHIIHKSFSGDNYCIFVKIDPERFIDSFNCLADYYFTNFNILIDQSCKNKNRLRYLSFDPDIYVNEKSNKFIAKNVKRFKEIDRSKTNYVYHEDDFDNILKQISERNIDLCQDDYFRYVNIGMSLANQFGANGEDKFHFVCSFGSKYNEQNAIKDYKGFVKNSHGRCTIGTFYYYCKEENISIYTEKTKTIINRVKIAKSQGKADVKQVAHTLKVANNIDASENDIKLIELLIEDKNDYSSIANEDESEIEQVEKFILNAFDPTYDELAHKIYLFSQDNKRKMLTDIEINDIYLSCKKNFDFNVIKSDVISILNSSMIPRFNTLMDFIRDNQGEYDGYIDGYIDCIDPGNVYNRWAFKKWLVGSVHNWTRHELDPKVSPLTLTLTGQLHGTGKTSFARHVLPKELRSYFIEGKIDSNDKDSMFRLSTSLIILDDEFGGKSIKDNKAFKALSDTTKITQRRPYGSGDMTYTRRAGLIGTSNELDVLKDVTGNRRILPIQVPVRIDYDTVISYDTTKMIVEAYNLLMSGYDWIIRTQEDIEYIKANSMDNETINPSEEIFFKYFGLERTNPFDSEVIYNQGEILDYLSKKTTIKIDKYDIRDIFLKNNIKYQAYRINKREPKKGAKLYLLDNNTESKTEDPF